MFLSCLSKCIFFCYYCYYYYYYYEFSKPSRLKIFTRYMRRPEQLSFARCSCSTQFQQTGFQSLIVIIIIIISIVIIISSIVIIIIIIIISFCFLSFIYFFFLPGCTVYNCRHGCKLLASSLFPSISRCE